MKLLRKIRYFYLKRYKPLTYSRLVGVKIGENTRLIGLPDWGSEPWLVSVGSHTVISFDCAFITHDGATSVFRNEEAYKNVLKYGRIVIGNHCFIGARSTLLPNVKVGDLSIVAAGSMVTKSIPPGEVWGGVPARFISTTKAYADKCKRNTPRYDVENYRKNFKEEVLKMTAPRTADEGIGQGGLFEPKSHGRN